MMLKVPPTSGISQVLEDRDGGGTTTVDYVIGHGLLGRDSGSDGNDDGALDVADAVALLNGLFSGGVIPGPQLCDIDPTDDSLDCATPAGSSSPPPPFPATKARSARARSRGRSCR